MKFICAVPLWVLMQASEVLAADNRHPIPEPGILGLLGLGAIGLGIAMWKSKK